VGGIFLGASTPGGYIRFILSQPIFSVADALREVPNQTRFVERALRDALGRRCAVCDGSGRVPRRAMRVTNLRRAAVGPLGRDGALRLKQIVRLGREAAATRLDVTGDHDRLAYVLRRDERVLLEGALSS
jgi:hypothetical protein